MAKSIIFSAAVLAGAVAFTASPSSVSADAPSAKDLAARGKLLFMRCAACHTVNAGGANKVGPNLSGVVGRKAGAAQGFKYSPAMSKAKVTWDETTLDKWLARPASVVPGTSMVFAGLAKPEDRKALIAYLKTPGS